MTSLNKKIVVLTCLKEYARASGDPRERLAVTSLPLKMPRGIQTHLLSTEINGKDCMQTWISAYALHAIVKSKLVLLIRRLMRAG